jgi:NADH dehydrogenase FAD-containing subunit
LLGAGHAHLLLLRRTHEFIQRGHSLTVIAPHTFWYSGLATGMLGGHYPPELDQVDVAALVTRGGGMFLQDSVVGTDPVKRIIQLAMGNPLAYDLLSVNLGSEPREIPGTHQHQDRVYPVKPIGCLWALRLQLESRFARPSRLPLQIVVAGAGASGCEIAANVAQLAASRNARVIITVLTAGATVLESLPPEAVRAVVVALEQRGVVFQCNARVTGLVNGAAVLADGSPVAFDLLVNATGLEPSPTVRELRLPVDTQGGLIVDQYLRSIAAAEVYGAGDCIALQGRALPKAGVYAVRSAPVLLHNLLAAAEGRPARAFHPQREHLLVMNLGDGTALATRGRWHWRGRAAFRLKDWIDRRFLRQYQI